MQVNNLKDFYSRNKALIIILFIAFLLRITLFIVYRPWDEQIVTNKVIQLDASGYHRLALCILTDGSFGGDTFRTPGYPLFVASHYFLFGLKPWFVFITQIFLNIFSIIMVYHLGKTILNKKIGLIASFLFAVDPHQIAYNVTLLSDTLFTSIFLASILLLVLGFKNKKIPYFLISAFVLGIATLVRPISQFFVFFTLGFILIYTKFKYSFRFKTIILYALLFILTISPWLYRNYSKYNHLNLSTAQGHNLLLYDVAYTEVLKTGKPIKVVQSEFQEKAIEMGYNEANNPFDNSIIYNKIAVNYIRNNWKIYFRNHFKGIFNMYTALGTQNISKLLNLESKDLSFHHFSSPGVLKMVSGFFKSKSFHEIIIGMIIFIFLMICYISFFYGCFLMIKNKEYFYFIMLIVTIVYFSIFTGVIGLSRYKLPITPFYITISAYGLFEAYTYYKNKRAITNK